MKLYVIKSDHDSTPLAEVRTDGNAVEYTVDNTDGALPAQSGKSFQKLAAIVAKSSHMSMEETQGPTVGLLRYELNNGDIIEITTDARTVMLNGRLLTDAEKRAVKDSIDRGEIQIARKADPTAPTPVLPTPPKAAETPRAPAGGLNQEVLSLLARNRSDKAMERSRIQKGSPDPSIDAIRTFGMSPDQGDHTKRLLYYMAHGAFPGDTDAD